MVYRSKVDWWIFLLVASGGAAVTIACLFNIITRGIEYSASWILLISSIFYWAVIFLLAYPVEYGITSPNLSIKSGLFTCSIPLASIEEVHRTRNPLSAPAWSLDRLHISYRKRGKKAFALVSPKNIRLFLEELTQKTPGLEMQGDRVIRTA